MEIEKVSERDTTNERRGLDEIMARFNRSKVKSVVLDFLDQRTVVRLQVLQKKYYDETIP